MERYIIVLKRLIEHKKALLAVEKDQKHKTSLQFGIRAIEKAVKALEDVPYTITCGKDAMKIPGVGKGIAERIDEINETGTLKELPKEESKKSKYVQKLCKIPGIGVAKAQHLVDEFGIKSRKGLLKAVENGELREAKNQLTHQIMIGLKYYKDLKKRVPREEITQYKKLISKVCQNISSRFVLEVCGSYRRKKESSGDIDILVSHPKNLLKDLVKKLEDMGLILDTYTSEASVKYMGVCRLDKDHPVRHIDIRYIEPSNWGTALLHFTGSDETNKRMRAKALEMGMSLSEYGLFRVDSGNKEKIDTPTEKDVFRMLELPYLKPSER